MQFWRYYCLFLDSHHYFGLLDDFVCGFLYSLLLLFFNQIPIFLFRCETSLPEKPIVYENASMIFYFGWSHRSGYLYTIQFPSHICHIKNVSKIANGKIRYNLPIAEFPSLKSHQNYNWLFVLFIFRFYQEDSVHRQPRLR